MDLKITGVVKLDEEWKKPGDTVKDVDEDVAEDLIAKGVAEETDEPIDDNSELAALRVRAKELDIPRASQMGEKKLVEAIAAAEAVAKNGQE